MYQLQESADPSCIYAPTGGEVNPVATLRNQYGGVSQIIVDDHCYVLLNGDYEKGFTPATHWYAEAVEVLRGFPRLM